MSRLLAPLLGLVLATSLNAQTTLIHEFLGDDTGDEFGEALAGAGDVNNDGVPDLIVGANRDDDNGAFSGKVTVFSGADGSVLGSWTGARVHAKMGNAVDGAGDVNNDGFDDVIFAEYHQASASPGVVYVRSGKDWSLLHQWQGDGDDLFGAAVAGIGDINSDGFDDVALSAVNDSTFGLSHGAVHLYSGQDGALIRSYYGANMFDFMGGALAGGKDVDGDTVPDVLVSTYLNGGGMAQVFSGATGNEIWKFTGSGQFGRHLDLSDDINNDGLAEIVIGDRDVKGHCWVFSGADASVLHVFEGEASGDLYGWAVCAVGDANGDGVPDFAVGAFGDDDNGSAAGTVQLYSGVDGVRLYKLNGFGYAAYFGTTVASVGDMDGDGLADLAVAASPSYDQATHPGYVEVYSGNCKGHAWQYGSGLAGSGGFVPQLDSCGCPAPNSTFTIKVSEGLGGAQGFIVLGAQQAAIPIFGGTLWILPPLSLISINLSGFGPGQGARDLALIMPEDQILIGLTLYMQAILVDGGTLFGHSMSNALGVTIQ